MFPAVATMHRYAPYAARLAGAPGRPCPPRAGRRPGCGRTDRPRAGSASWSPPSRPPVDLESHFTCRRPRWPSRWDCWAGSLGPRRPHHGPMTVLATAGPRGTRGRSSPTYTSFSTTRTPSAARPERRRYVERRDQRIERGRRARSPARRALASRPARHGERHGVEAPRQRRRDREVRSSMPPPRRTRCGRRTARRAASPGTSARRTSYSVLSIPDGAAPDAS